MDRNNSGESRIAAISQRQYGVFHREQALDVGLSRHQIEHRCATGRWDTIHPAVHRIGGTPSSIRQRMMAAVLWAGPDAAVSHRSAAVLWGFDGIVMALIEVTAIRRLRSTEVSVHAGRQLPTADRTEVYRIPATTPTRTLVDIAPLVDEEVLETALESVLRRRLATVARLEWRLEELGARSGTAVLRKLVKQRQNRPLESRFEVRFERLLRHHGVPLPERQRVVTDERGRQRVDFAYPEARIVIECVSWRHHSGQKAWREDLARRRRLTAAGWRVIEFTWQEVSWEPVMVVTTVVDALKGPDAQDFGRAG